MVTPIAFGTDGWRAVVGEDFVPANIERVAQAFCDLYPQLEKTGQGIAIGYDRRNQSPEAAALFAEVVTGNGIPVLLSQDYCPTPCVSWLVKTRGLTAGVMITASHNPPKWNGIKFKESTGGAASTDFVRPIEEQIRKNDGMGKKAKRAKFEENALLTTFNGFGDYLTAIRNLIDIDLIQRQNYRVLIEPLFGAGVGFFPKLLGKAVEEMHNAHDLNFGGLHPEPIPPYVNEAMERMKKGTYSCCLITDGDADRAGAIDEKGNFVTTHEIYSLLIKHAVENKKLTGTIIKSISTTQMIDRLGKKYGCNVVTTPVGFRYISPAMKEPGVLCGGEESGGYAFPYHVPERDGVFSGLLLLELMATMKKSLGQLVADLQRDVGPTTYRRIDTHLTQDQIATARAKFETLDVPSFDGHRMVKHTTIDGHHFLFDDDAWLLFRASGTEPLVRIYAEARTQDHVDAMLAFGKKLLGL
ncbi:MAG: phosphoglucomutase/phosphomannomutase family protein [Deltaproteobacteria bacterium]|nr:phosphoglucomutase/phosphomannomutase family protein [Deltaproteobacteria bacterium]